MYKLIAVDLDETLLNSEHLIGEGDINAIKNLKDVKLVMCSGRSFVTMQPFLKELDLYNKENEYTISFNGAIISENKNNRIIYQNGIDNETANMLFQLGKKYDICLHFYTTDAIYIYNYWEPERIFLSNRFKIIEFFDEDLSFLQEQKIIKVIYGNENLNILRQIEQENKDVFKNFDISYSSNRYLEINALGINKGYGLTKLCSLLNIPLNETIAVGDNLNDLSMIKVAGLGVGVKNSVEELKPYCDYITNNDNDHNAIKEIIDKYF